MIGLHLNIFTITYTAGEYSQYRSLFPNQEILSTSRDIIHFLCLIREIVS